MPTMEDRIDAMLRGELPGPPVGKLIGMRLIECAMGQARFELDADERHWNSIRSGRGGSCLLPAGCD